MLVESSGGLWPRRRRAEPESGYAKSGRRYLFFASVSARAAETRIREASNGGGGVTKCLQLGLVGCGGRPGKGSGKEA